MAFCLISSRTIRSLGAKPVSGGRPASERRTRRVVAVRVGVFDHEIEISDIFVVEIVMRDRNMDAVMKI